MPRHISLFKARHEVFPFIPKVKVCFACYKVGHVSKVCRDKPRCIFCGKERHPNGEQCELKDTPHKCINSGGGYLPTSMSCPFIIENKKIQALAAAKDIPVIETRKEIRAANGSRSSALSGGNTTLDYSNFPLFGPH